MNVHVAAVADSRDLGDPADAARQYAGRKTFRLLERLSIPPFVVAHRLLDAVPRAAVPDLGLLTVSGWEPAVPPDVAGEQDDHLTTEGIVARMQESIPPTRWLTGLPNNALCQIAVAAGIHGPNMHIVGDADAAEQALAFAGELVERGEAPAVLAVAFDPPGERLLSPDSVASDAAGLLIVGADTSDATALAVPAVARIGWRATDLVRAMAHEVRAVT